MNEKRKIIIGVLVLLVVITMGYALFSETITIGGTAKSEGDLSVIMNVNEDNIWRENGTNLNKFLLSSDKKTFEFNVTFDYPGAFLEIPFNILNNGSLSAVIKDIKIEGVSDYIDVANGLINNDIIAYIVNESYTSKDDLNIADFKNTVLAPNESKDFTLFVTWNDEIENKNTNLSLKIKVSLDVTQLVNSELPGGGNNVIPGQKYAVGDKFCFNNECFNVLSSDGVNIRALASKNITTNIGTPQAPIYPKQTDEFDPITFYNRKTPDDMSGYWVDENNNLLPKYENEYVYDENSNLYPIINKYVEYLKNELHVNVIDSGLITTTELIKMGKCWDKSNGYGVLYSCPRVKNDFYQNNNYWLGNPYEYNGIWVNIVDRDGTIDPENPTNSYITLVNFYEPEYAGIRPVIKIPIGEVSKAY